MKKLLAISALACAISGAAIAQSGFKTTASGLKYKFFKQGKSRKALAEDVVTIGMTARNSKDSIIDNSYNKSHALAFPLKKNLPLFEAFSMMGEGDSAVFLINADKYFDAKAGNPRPNYIEAGSLVKFVIKMKKVQTFEEYKTERHAHFVAQKAKDDKAILDYLASKGLKSTKTESGLHYVTLSIGVGVSPKKGDDVVVHYTAKLLNSDKPFDNTYDKKVPFDFALGWGLVVKGLDEGISTMKEGEKRLILIPSYLAYGEKGQHGIVPPDSPLVYEVELLKVASEK